MINDPAEEVAGYQARIAEQDAAIATLEAEAAVLPQPTQVSPTPAPATVEGPQSPALDGTATVLYEVRPGDSWWSIAKTLLADGQRYEEVREANEDKALDPGDIVEVPSVPVI